MNRGLIITGLIILSSCACAAARIPRRDGIDRHPDTTSGNFTWTVDTIGADGSTLYDCCIVNDSLAYAVGWIMPHDSAAQNSSLDWYNSAVWNGHKWTPIQVPVYYNGRKTFSPVHSVFARGKDDVWFGLYYMVHWDGHSYSQTYPDVGSFENKIWISAGGPRLYAVGDYGAISYSHDHGKSWIRVRTGTKLSFQDVWGSGRQVLAIASDDNGDNCLVSLEGDKAVHLDGVFPFVRSLSGVWFAPGEEYFLVGNGIYENKRFGPNSWRFDPFIWQINRYETAVRGDSATDVFTAGFGGSLAHWNGESWRTYPRIGNTHDRLRAISVDGNVVIAVGQRYYDNLRNCGVIYVGIRHPEMEVNRASVVSHTSKKYGTRQVRRIRVREGSRERGELR